ncbi:MAG: ATP-grasp domain-containing protein [Gammaproteobacteria bacterium]
MPNYLVVATSGRAISHGLKSLGCSVAVVDGFTDSDTCAVATEFKKVKRSQFGLDQNEVLSAVVSLQSKISFEGLFFDAAMESNPSLLDEINITPVFGNSSQVISACKNPNVFFSALDKHSVSYPEILLSSRSNPVESDRWLVKEAHSTGGVGVSFIKSEVDFSKNIYFQKKVDGINFSLTFLANGEDISELGFNTLWNESLSESVPYAYAGAINRVNLDIETQESALQYAKVITKEFGLIGLNSIDFIYADHVVYVLEVNPRIPATYELYETRYGEIMQKHIDVCKGRTLPATKFEHRIRAHAIVYAPTKITVSDSMLWPLWTADRPHVQEVINKDAPVCSIFAGGQNCSQVCEMIKTRKQSILAKLYK